MAESDLELHIAITSRKARPEDAGEVRRRFGVHKICGVDDIFFLEFRSYRFEADGVFGWWQPSLCLAGGAAGHRRRRVFFVATRGSLQKFERDRALSRGFQHSPLHVPTRA